MTRHEFTNPFPQEQQRVVVLLVFGADERTAQFQRGRESCDQTLVVSKQRSRVETLNASSGRDSIGLADAVRADNSASVAVPGKQVEVPVVERIEIDAAAGPFPDRPEGDLTESSDFTKRRPYLSGFRTEHLERSALDETRLDRQPRDFRRYRVGLADARHDVPRARNARPSFDATR